MKIVYQYDDFELRFSNRFWSRFYGSFCNRFWVRFGDRYRDSFWGRFWGRFWDRFLGRFDQQDETTKQQNNETTKGKTMTNQNEIIEKNYQLAVADFLSPINEGETRKYMTSFFMDEFNMDVSILFFDGKRSFLSHYENRFPADVYENLESKCYPMSSIKLCLGGYRIAQDLGEKMTPEDLVFMRQMESIGGYCFYVTELPGGETEVSVIKPPVKDDYVMHNGSECYHNESGPARLFTDGTAMYAIKGVLLGDEARDLFDVELTTENVKRICQIKNVDERAAIMGKYGIENFVKLGIDIDSDSSLSEYRLVDMAPVYDDRQAKFLYMKNLSDENKYHLEGVSNDCELVQDAIDFRAAEFLDFIGQKHWNPCVIDGVEITGGDHRKQQQGDKLIFTPEKINEQLEIELIVGRKSIGGADSRHCVKSGDIYNVAIDNGNTSIELLKTTGTPLEHPEHGTFSIIGDSYIGTVRQMDHETGIIEDVLD